MNDTDRPDTSGPTPAPPRPPAGQEPPPSAVQVQVVPYEAPRRGSWLRRVLVILLIVSVVMNAYLAAILAARIQEAYRSEVVRAGNADQEIAVWNVEGMIDAEQAETFVAFCDWTAKRPEVKAVVLRVNSTGGGVPPSDRMHASVLGLKAAGKKVVVSMGGVAASGGYWISAPADQIVAEPTTTTGSIGVIAMWPVFKDMLEKIGVEPIVMKSQDAHKWKDELSPLDAPSPDQREHLQSILDGIQDRFEEVVRKGRGKKLKTEDVTYEIPVLTADGQKKTVTHTATAPLNGKVYVGSEAKDWGLVDTIGYQSDALTAAARLAGLDKPNIVQYRPRLTFGEQLFGQGVSTSGGLTIDADLISEVQSPRIMAIWRVE